MNPDFRIPVSFIDHPKLDDLIEQLGEPALRCLLRLWNWAATNSIEGRLPNTPQRIASLTDWQGDSKQFVRVLVKLRWIDKAGREYHLHEWAEHQPFVVTARERIERSRAAGKKSAEARAERFGTAQPNSPLRTGRSTVTERVVRKPKPNQTKPGLPAEREGQPGDAIAAENSIAADNIRPLKPQTKPAGRGSK